MIWPQISKSSSTWHRSMDFRFAKSFRYESFYKVITKYTFAHLKWDNHIFSPGLSDAYPYPFRYDNLVPWIPLDSLGFPWIPLDSLGSSWIPWYLAIIPSSHCRYATPALIVFALLLSISGTSWFVQRIAGVPSCKPGEEWHGDLWTHGDLWEQPTWLERPMIFLIYRW